jgi:hypothetical protein
MSHLIQHVRKVAKDDVRLYFAPFVALYKAVRRELKRPAIR